jgi:hypothetical protein
MVASCILPPQRKEVMTLFTEAQHEEAKSGNYYLYET